MNKVTWLDRGLITSPYFIGLCLSEEAFFRELRSVGLVDQDAAV